MNEIMKKVDPYASLRIGEFRKFLVVRFSIIFALNMESVIIGWKVYEITRDPLSLGLIGLAEFLPALSLALFAGHLVDRQEKRNLMRKCVYGYLICCASFLLITSNFSLQYLSEQLVVNLMYITTFAGGIIRAFSGPTTFSLFSLVVPKELYPNASTWSSSSWQAGAVLGPLMGGLMYAWAGITITFTIVLLFLMIALFSLFTIRPKPVHYQPASEKIWSGLTEGIQFVFHSKEILSTLSLDLFAVLFGGAVALLPIYADKILHCGPEGLGVLRAAPAVGSCITLFMVAFIPLDKKPGLILLGAIFGFGLSMIVFGISVNFYLSVFALFLSGLFDGVSVIIRNTILQIKTPDRMRGRVAAVHSMFVGSSNEFGAFESGLTAKWMGTVPAVVFGGCMTLIVVLTTFFTTPSQRNLEF